MEIYYINSAGKRVDFTGGSYKMLSPSDLFDYKWDYSTKGVNVLKVAAFSKRFREKEVQLVVSASTKTEYYQKITELMEILDRDIGAVTPGRLYVGNTYLQCFFVSSEKPKRYINTQKTIVNLKLLAENGNWIHEEKKSFAKVTNALYETDGLDYPHDYPFDYTNNLVNQKIVNDNYAASDFEMVIYGSCENPAISIGTHTYEVNASLIVGEYIVINSLTRKIYKVKNSGEQVNLFYLRGRDFYIFEKIPAGIMSVAWNGSFGFDIKLMSERSEPKWI